VGLVAGVGVLAVGNIAHAAPVKVQASLSNPRTEVGRGVYLRVEVTAEGDAKLADPELPELPGLEIAEQGTSFQSSMSFGTGQRMVREVTRTHEYLVFPTKPGKYTLAVSVRAGGKKITPTRTPVLEVTGEAVGEARPQAAEAGARPTEPTQDVFLWPTVDKEVVYVGEPLLYRFEIWERANADVQLRTMPSFDDFWVEELEAGNRRRDQVGGVPYRVHPLLERVLFPQKAGKLTIGGGEVVVSPHGGLGLLRPRRREPPYQVGGVPVAIEVRALPAEGRPVGFSANNVGQFAIQAAVDRTEVEQGEAFKLTITVEGTGNVRFAEPAPWPELEGLRRYDPKEEFQLAVTGDEIGGTRTYEFLIVAEEAGTLEIPAHTLAYFDPERAEYAVARTEPIRVEVEPNADAVVADHDGLEDVSEDGGETELLADVFTAQTLPRAQVEPGWLTPARWATGALTVPATLGVGLAGRAVLRRLRGDEATQRRLARAAERRKLIERASEAVGSGEGFAPAIAALLQGIAVHRAGPAGVGLPRERLLALLAREGVAEAEIAKLRELLDTCDAARFGSGALDEVARRDLLDRAKTLAQSSAWKETTA
jgi:hypothetical protein